MLCPACERALQEPDIGRIVHLGDGLGAVERCLHELVAVACHRAEEDAVALGTVRLGDEPAGAEDRVRIVERLIRVVYD